MEVKILNQSDNPLLSRKQVTVEVEHDKAGTPDRAAIRKAIASRLSAKPESVFIVKMRTITGVHRTRCYVDVYDTPDVARKVLPEHLVERNFPSPKKEKEKPPEKEIAKTEAKPKAELQPKPEPKPKGEEKPKAKAEPKKEEPKRAGPRKEK